MKNAIIFLSFVLSLSSLHGQTIPPNTQCYGAQFLCSSTFEDTTFTETYGDSTTLNAIDFYTHLYYTFQAGTGATGPNYMVINTPYNKSTYTIYGPFSSEDVICDQYFEMLDSMIVDSTTSTALTHPISTTLTDQSWYLMVVNVLNLGSYAVNHVFYGDVEIEADPNTMICKGPLELGCENCIPTFQPKLKQFILSAWVKEDISGGSAITTYSHTKVVVTGDSNPMEFFPSGQIIDGWQRIEGVFLASNTGTISVELVCSDGEAYFDDIRIFPFDGSMMSYVYDPITHRLMAELDERNYAKLYEYDEEGKLVRVKKETEKGIMTIQENRDNNSKQ